MTPETPGRRRARRPSERRPGDRSERPRERGAQAASGAGRALLAGVGEVLAIGTEMLRIPAEMALGLAERLGLLILAAWRFLRPLLLALLTLLRRGLAIAERELTPLRAVVGVLVAAAILLAVSQFLDYREVRAGVPAYQDVELVAPPPQVTGSTRTA